MFAPPAFLVDVPFFTTFVDEADDDIAMDESTDEETEDIMPTSELATDEDTAEDDDVPGSTATVSV